jgi:uncharacterized protein YjbI with pentapeptide repeats
VYLSRLLFAGPNTGPHWRNASERRFGEDAFSERRALTIEGGTFANLDFESFEVIGMQFVDCKFRDVHFSEGEWAACSFTNCEFSDLSIYVDFSDSTFQGCRLRGAPITSGSFTSAKFEKCNFDDVEIYSVDMEDISVSQCVFSHSNLLNCEFDEAHVSGNFHKCHWWQCRFNHASFYKVEMMG